MKVIAISDQHGVLPEIPQCDLCIIAGDVCPTVNHQIWFQQQWLDTNFRFWLKTIPAKKIVGIAGNHDYIFQKAAHKVPTLPWTYLQDSYTEFEGYKIWGTPWQPYFFDWAFNLYEKDLVEKWALIPRDTDILVVHGPPHGYGDLAPRIITDANEEDWPSSEHCGSPGLLSKIQEIKPKLVVFGHIHEGRGEWNDESTKYANVTILDGRYCHIHKPWRFELPPKSF